MINADIWHCEVFFRVAISVGIWRKESTPFTFAIQDWKKTSIIQRSIKNCSMEIDHFCQPWDALSGKSVVLYEMELWSSAPAQISIVTKARFTSGQRRNRNKPTTSYVKSIKLGRIFVYWKPFCRLILNIEKNPIFEMHSKQSELRKSQNLTKSVISDTPSH